MTEKTALVVLGMHRSGTSSVAGALALLGATPPKTLLEPAADNPKGFWESRAVIEINDRILQAGESWWNDWRRFDAGKLSQNQVLGFRQEIASLLDSEFGDAPAIVLKDPRLCRLWPIWKPALREAGYAPRCLLPIRSPLEVARSLTARNGLSLAEGLTLWLRHVLDAERDTRGASRRILLWADFMRDWRKQLELARGSLQLDLEEPDPDAAEKVDAFLTPDLQHQHSSAEDLERADASHPWAAEAFELLKALSRDDGPDGHGQLDAFARRFEVACDLWGRALGPVLWRAHAAPIFEIERDQARAHAAALEAERAAAAAEQQAQDRQAVEAIDRLTRLLAALQAQQAETAAAYARAVQDAADQRARDHVATADAQSQAAETLADRDRRLAEAAHDRDRLLAEQEEAQASARAEAQALRIAVSKGDAAVAALQASLNGAVAQKDAARRELEMLKAHLAELERTARRRPIRTLWRLRRSGALLRHAPPS